MIILANEDTMRRFFRGYERIWEEAQVQK